MRRVGVGAKKPETKADSKLKKEIKDLKAENEQLRAEIAALKAENEQLRAEIAALKAGNEQSAEK